MSWWGRYIGIPFGQETGSLTCWGLVRAVYKDQLGVELPTYGEISARDLARIARKMEEKKDDGWDAVPFPAEFDVVLMSSARGGKAVVHVGVAIDRFKMIHVQESSDSVCVPINHFSTASRILGFRRLSCRRS